MRVTSLADTRNLRGYVILVRPDRDRLGSRIGREILGTVRRRPRPRSNRAQLSRVREFARARVRRSSRSLVQRIIYTDAVLVVVKMNDIHNAYM